MGSLKVGEHTYGTVVRRGDMNNITIGKYCSIATNVIADSGFNHNTKLISTYPFRSMWGVDVPHNAICKGDISIGNDVWIGENVLLMSGIIIGDGAIIGANSVVTKDVLPYSIVAGSPAATKKFRFTAPQIQKLLAIKWWDWGAEKVKENVKLLNEEVTDEILDKLLNL